MLGFFDRIAYTQAAVSTVAATLALFGLASITGADQSNDEKTVTLKPGNNPAKQAALDAQERDFSRTR